MKRKKTSAVENCASIKKKLTFIWREVYFQKKGELSQLSEAW